MNLDDARTLLTPETVALLNQFAKLGSGRDALSAVSALRRAGATPRQSAVIMTQLKLRRQAHVKFGEFAQRMLFTRDGLAQATRLEVAAHHANRFRHAGCVRVADLGCGIGADSMALAGLGFELLAVDADEVTAAIATHNLALFPNATVAHARAEDVDLTGFDGVFLDPARRAQREGATEPGDSVRLSDPAQWQPSLEFAFGFVDGTRAVGVKLGPALDHNLIPDTAEAQWVSVGGDLVECSLWFGAAARDRVRRSALLISASGTGEMTAATSIADAVPDAAVGELGAWLHEPDAAIIRGRFIGQLAAQFGGRMIAPQIAWITTDGAVETPFAKSFRVLEQFKLDIATLKRELQEREIGTLEIKVRGVDIDPQDFRRKLQLKGHGSATLICTRLGERRVAILAERA
ncbi:class I SAM-dependent methyltransferase [uncultured Gulosibacter sp.]|uniref:class I SAM-dependent methyltransferase n=1 Tax=uncultured Gulosibacter sp. TaxID=1339167 RepID=UPI00288B7182|nr:class I SAM-dependent methyltransferase [uncultured Gulosibacter sp.]